jgi:hypothetical protein
MRDNDQKLTVVVFRRRDSDPFEARIIQNNTLGPNLSPKTGTVEMAKSAALRRLRAEGWYGEVLYEDGLPDGAKFPLNDEPAPPRRGLRRAKTSPSLDLFQ